MKPFQLHLLLATTGIRYSLLQAALCEHLGLRPVPVGELLRECLAGQDALATELRSLLDTGTLLPDALITEVVQRSLQALGQDTLLIGYPRTAAQLDLLEAAVENIGYAPQTIWMVQPADPEAWMATAFSAEKSSPESAKFPVDANALRERIEAQMRNMEAIREAARQSGRFAHRQLTDGDLATQEAVARLLEGQ